jgi:hypothetical protein
MSIDTLSSETYSFHVWYWHDGRTDATQLRVVRTDTGEEVHLTDGSLLLRVFTQPETLTTRCLIRHMKSGREVYLQSGQYLLNFVHDHLLEKENPLEPLHSGETDI